MLAARIAGRVLSRTVIFGFKGALVMMIAGVIEGAIFGIAFNFMPRLHSKDVSGSFNCAAMMLPLGFLTGLLVFAVAGALMGRRSNTYNLFTKIYQNAILGSFVGATIGAICLASLFAMLTWFTHKNFLLVPSIYIAPLSTGNLQASAFGGYLSGVVTGFFMGTAIGAWRGATNAIKRESSTRMETN